MKIAVAGVGYVGLSLATLLAQKYEVVTLNIHQAKTDLINNRKSPIKDAEIEDFFAHKKLNLRATTDWKEAFKDAEFVVITTPTNYDDEEKHFDTSAVEDIIEKVIKVQKNNPSMKGTTMVVKSTIPVGYIESIRKKYQIDNIFFSPEFLREGHALYDNLHPSRIIIGSNDPSAHKFADLLIEGSLDEGVPVKFMGATEAEAVKLFANTYLALRVAYFNELDTYAELKNLNTKDIIDGVSLDPRIGSHYNNPSFGFGGYCLPKDTKQLLANYEGVPQTIIKAVVEANRVRKQHIVDMILQRNPKVVGIYRLVMKSGSDNFRESAVQNIIKLLQEHQIKVIIYEPILKKESFNGCDNEKSLSKFKGSCDIIVANRISDELSDVKEKIYTRDLYLKD